MEIEEKITRWIRTRWGDRHWTWEGPPLGEYPSHKFVIGMYDGTPTGRVGFGQTLEEAFTDFKRKPVRTFFSALRSFAAES